MDVETFFVPLMPLHVQQWCYSCTHALQVQSTAVAGEERGALAKQVDPAVHYLIFVLIGSNRPLADRRDAAESWLSKCITNPCSGLEAW
jgi:hypothetical protein